MTEQRQYIALENLALNNAQRDSIVTGLTKLGRREFGLPHERMQLRLRPDNQAAILEATFDDGDLNLNAWKNRLAALFSVAPGTITTRVEPQTYGGGSSSVVTFGRGGTDYLRVHLFGGANPSVGESQAEVKAYLAANAAAWSTEDVP